MITKFLKTQGRQIVTEDGQPILLKGWGIGNWLLQEGYMWQAHGQLFDRPRRIEQTIADLTDQEFAQDFWQAYRDNYFTEADVAYIHQQGYNSLRLPFNASLFLDDAGDVDERNFYLMDQAIAWAKKYDLYVWIDMHGAPGGQTGANIDDSIGDVPNLYLVPEYWHQALQLWQFIARRYADEPAVAGYDLLNEPIRPGNDHLQDFDYLLPKLAQFYDEAIAKIRAVDARHMFSLEGYHWASDPSVFNHHYDDNYVIHFHRYGVLPSQETFAEFLAVSRQYDVPLWLGETGENNDRWFAGMAQLCEANQVSRHFWTYKKMGRQNSGVTVKTPDNWSLIMDYLQTGRKPAASQVKTILADYLDNIKFANCLPNPDVDRHILLKPPVTYAAVNFSEVPGSYRGATARSNFVKYHQGKNLDIIVPDLQQPGQSTFDVHLDDYRLRLHESEFVTYTFWNQAPAKQVQLWFDDQLTAANSQIQVVVNDQEIFAGPLVGIDLQLPLAQLTQVNVKIVVISGVVGLAKINLF